MKQSNHFIQSEFFYLECLHNISYNNMRFYYFTMCVCLAGLLLLQHSGTSYIFYFPFFISQIFKDTAVPWPPAANAELHFIFICIPTVYSSCTSIRLQVSKEDTKKQSPERPFHICPEVLESVRPCKSSLERSSSLAKGYIIQKEHFRVTAFRNPKGMTRIK